MAETEQILDERYTDGIWYDLYNGDFCRIEDWGEGVALLTPDGDHFHTMTYHEWSEEKPDFRQVSDAAVEDPAGTVRRAIRLLSRNDINELSTVPHQFSIDLRYAREQVEIRQI